MLRAGRASGYGNALYIQDADGNVHIYGHMRYYYVEAGDIVPAGDQIAKVGNEGQSTGPHLHYEIHRGEMTAAPPTPRPGSTTAASRSPARSVVLRTPPRPGASPAA